ncbi:MAG: ribosome recycling factor [Armatimonadota bacterium]|nr:ribosome recycling factor [Armatimonadota bacterium]MCX7778210.1 ribosome recycling factor [Armatimonadota bacterium]MDW8025675.1 ribosome recycling factor [Armatimonadota bacterium]
MHEAIKALLNDAEQRMKKAVEATASNLAMLRTGRATPALLDHIRVEYYGTMYQLKQLATITAPEPRLLIIAPWDKSLIDSIQRAILGSDIGLTPSTDGNVIKVPIPPLTEERRHELVKLTNKRAEEGKVAVRNVRRDILEELRKLEKEQSISEDEVRRARSELDKITSKHIDEIEALRKAKEQEILEG